VTLLKLLVIKNKIKLRCMFRGSGWYWVETQKNMVENPFGLC